MQTIPSFAIYTFASIMIVLGVLCVVSCLHLIGMLCY